MKTKIIVTIPTTQFDFMAELLNNLEVEWIVDKEQKKNEREQIKMNERSIADRHASLNNALQTLNALREETMPAKERMAKDNKE